MGSCDEPGFNGRNLQFDKLRKTVGVNNKNESLNDNSKNNVMPVVGNNDIPSNSCGSGSLPNSKFQNVCEDVNALDAMSHVNMAACDCNALFMDSHKAFDSSTNFAPQHGSPPGPMIAHVRDIHQPFPRNLCL